MCIKSAGITEDLQKIYRVLQKICKYSRTCAENLQYHADFLHILWNTCRSSVIPADFLHRPEDFLHIFWNRGTFSATPCRFHSHHQNIALLYLCQDIFPPGKYAKSISRNAHYVIAFKNPRDQLGMKNLLFQAFPTCWQDMMDVYQKVTERPFGYTVLDLHPASDDRKRVFSHLLTHEGYPRWHRRIKKEGV